MTFLCIYFITSSQYCKLILQRSNIAHFQSVVNRLPLLVIRSHSQRLYQSFSFSFSFFLYFNTIRIYYYCISLFFFYQNRVKQDLFFLLPIICELMSFLYLTAIQNFGCCTLQTEPKAVSTASFIFSHIYFNGYQSTSLKDFINLSCITLEYK